MTMSMMTKITMKMKKKKKKKKKMMMMMMMMTWLTVFVPDFKRRMILPKLRICKDRITSTLSETGKKMRSIQELIALC
jgi:accessory gene regulator protein AgrB